MKITAIERKKVSDEVFEQMKAMIAEGQWKPGDKIPSENELKNMFNVSRVTIREALKKLASYNIIETRQGSGSFIREVDSLSAFDNAMVPVYMQSMDDCTIRDMMEFRNIIEVESIYYACQRATEEDIEHLKKIYANMIASRHDVRQFSTYDLEFHKYIAELTKNVVMIKCYTIIFDFMKEYFDKVVEKIGVDRGSYFHGKIIDALENKDPKEARRIMREHLNVTYQDFFGENA